RYCSNIYTRHLHYLLIKINTTNLKKATVVIQWLFFANLVGLISKTLVLCDEKMSIYLYY
ncbi:MAG: hypothetical protein WC154_01080, partial [Candidatus Izemoplasmatales bacterium]